MVRQTSATTTTPDTKSLQKSIDGKVSNQEVSSASPLGGLQSDSDSIAFSDMLKKIRIIHEKCPKCLLLHWRKIGTSGTSSFSKIQVYKEYLSPKKSSASHHSQGLPWTPSVFNWRMESDRIMIKIKIDSIKKMEEDLLWSCGEDVVVQMCLPTVTLSGTGQCIPSFKQIA